jgi:hypothetical protein
MAAITQDQIVLAQLSAAFGQGAGTVFVSEAAAGAALAHFMPAVPDFVSRWSAVALQTLEYARTVGRTAALLAAQRGSDAISEDDFVKGLSIVRGTRQTYGPCPFKHGPGHAPLA